MCYISCVSLWLTGQKHQSDLYGFISVRLMWHNLARRVSAKVFFFFLSTNRWGDKFAESFYCFYLESSVLREPVTALSWHPAAETQLSVGTNKQQPYSLVSMRSWFWAINLWSRRYFMSLSTPFQQRCGASLLTEDFPIVACFGVGGA